MLNSSSDGSRCWQNLQPNAVWVGGYPHPAPKLPRILNVKHTGRGWKAAAETVDANFGRVATFVYTGKVHPTHTY